MVSKIVSWVRQPTTIAGIAALAGVLTGVASGAMTLPAAAATAVGALVAMILPDNSAVAKEAGVVASDATILAQTLAPLLATHTTTTTVSAAGGVSTSSTSNSSKE